MKKIAIIGTHGVGKTTVAYGIGYRLKRLGYDANVLNEGARKCPLPLNKKSTLNSQKWILGDQLKQESLINPNIDFAICDRTVMDVYVYSLTVNRKFAKSILPLVVEHMRTYDYIFYLSIVDKYLKGDSVRIANKQYQLNIDNKMLQTIKFLEPYGIKVTQMVNNDNVVTHIVGIIGILEGFIQ